MVILNTTELFLVLIIVCNGLIEGLLEIASDSLGHHEIMSTS